MAIVLWTSSPKETEDLLGQHFREQGCAWRVVPNNEAPKADPKSDVILGMGTTVFKQFQSAGLAPKNRALSSMRGKRFSTPSGVPALITFDPTVCFREADKPQEIVWDVNLAIRLARTGSLRPVTGNYKWGSLPEVVEAVHAHECMSDMPFTVLAMDLETHGLYPWYPDRHIVTSQWTWEDDQALVVDHRNYNDLEALKFLVTDPGIRLWGANLKYDSVWLREKWGVIITNFTFDTTLGGSLVDENRSNSLNNHTKIYVPALGGYDDEFNKKADKSNMPAELDKDPETFKTYAGGDTDAVRKVGFCIGRALRQDYQLARFYEKILHPAARAFESIERRGVLVDPKIYKEVGEKVKKDIDELTHKAMMAIPMAVRAKHSHDLRLSRPSLLRDAFFSVDGYGFKPHKDNLTAKRKDPQTTQDHFKKFVATEAKPLVEALESLGSANKTRSTFVDGFLKHLRPDNRFHPSYIMYHGGLYDDSSDDSGSVTGRLATKEPAINTLPKHTAYTKLLRSAYIAPPGYEFWQLDFSQGELRVTADLADETNMIKVYQGDGDLHSLTAAELNGYDVQAFMKLKTGNPDLFKELRQGGKAGNFGLIYGMGAKGFVTYAFKQYGVVISLSDAQKFRNKFRNELYPRLPFWHEESIEEAHRRKFIRNPLGRIRHLPLIDSYVGEVQAKAERQAINSPVQSALNDLCLYLVAMVEAAYGDCEDEFSVNGSTHDAIYGYVKEGTSDVWFPKIQAIHEEMHSRLRTEFEWDPHVDFPIDWELGTTWATLKEVKLGA